MNISKIIMIIMAVFFVLGALDRLIGVFAMLSAGFFAVRLLKNEA